MRGARLDSVVNKVGQLAAEQGDARRAGRHLVVAAILARSSAEACVASLATRAGGRQQALAGAAAA